MKRDELKDVRGVIGQMLGILTEQNVQATLASLKETDVLILPELGDFSAADFDQMKKTLPIGEAAARKVADRLAKLVRSAVSGSPPTGACARRRWSRISARSTRSGSIRCAA